MKTYALYSIPIAMVFLTGCVAPGRHFAAVNAATPARADTAGGGAVYLLRGLGGFSRGLDRLGDALAAKGVRSEVYQHTQWSALAAALIATRSNNRDGKPVAPPPIVLIGHSYGADNVLRIARSLDRAGVGVRLLVTLDPVTPIRVPANVQQSKNFYLRNGVWDIFPCFRGVPLRAVGGQSQRVDNIDLRRERPDLLRTRTNHSNIDENPDIRIAIVAEVIAACSPAAETSGAVEAASPARMQK